MHPSVARLVLRQTSIDGFWCHPQPLFGWGCRTPKHMTLGGGTHQIISARALVGTCFLLLAAAGGAVAQTSAAASSPVKRMAPGRDVSATFVDRSEQAGLDAILTYTYAHAAAWGDVNGDGYPDLFWGSWTNQGPNRLLLNNGDGTFRESLQDSINVTNGRASGAVFADLDNDGDLDLIVVHNWRAIAPAGNQLLRNDGKGNFVDITAGSGLDLPQFSGRNPFILDYDGDGLLDVIVQHDMWGGASGFKRTFLLRNQGGMRFADVTAKAALPAEDNVLVGLGGAVGDINGDGWPDFMHVGSARKGKIMPPDIRLYVNNRDGTFRLATAFDFSATFPQFGNGEDWVCGAALGDLNGDGRIDAVIGLHYGSAALSDARRKAVSVRAYLNLGNDDDGSPRWRDITDACGLRKLFVKQPHVEIQDFNNDGRMDIWNTISTRRTPDGEQIPCVQYNLGNDADGVPLFAPPPGLDDEPASQPRPGEKRSGGLRYSAVAPTADYDLDGRLDIFRAGTDLFRNTTENIGSYLAVKVDLGAATANRFGVGARVSLYAAGQAGSPDALLGVQLIELGNGYCSGQTATAHFGLGGRRQVDVVVQMPCGGPAIKVLGVRTNQALTVSK